MDSLYLLVLFLSVQFMETNICEGTDVITAGQTLSGNQTISSKGGTFELGFFTPGQSKNHYIGIWYKNFRFLDKTVVWVANRNHPISNPYNSELILCPNGSLALLNESKIPTWSSNSTSTADNSTLAILLDDGNFVTRDNQDYSNIIWQSFDYPTDTWLPGGKIGYNKIKKEKIYLTSWRSAENPAPGGYSLEVDTDATSLIVVYNMLDDSYRSEVVSTGAWTGTNFVLVPDFDHNPFISNFKYISDADEIKFTYEVAILKRFTRFLIVEGKLKLFVCRGDFPECHWDMFWDWPSTQCEVQNFCGAFGTCNKLQVFPCNCLPGYERVSNNWTRGDYTDGCIRKSRLECGVGGGGEDTFLMVYLRISYPSKENSQSVDVESDEECKSACLRNCTCTGYVFDGYRPCVLWNGKVYNVELGYSYSAVQFNVRIAKSGKASKISVWIVVAASGGFIILLGTVSLSILQRGKRKVGIYDGATAEDLMLFKYKDIRKSTKNFSEKLGEGGFGSVFKGTLPNSRAIAVKRLKNLKQGEKQFRAEVSTIGQIQHINLVHLLGLCIEGEKRLLVFEYMKNGSLENHLFCNNSNVFLDWKARYNVMVGTARGLNYLHEKCRDCIIHCDIKPENILLDDEYNAKVADFGLAKLHGRECSRVLTTIRGTRGYLTPEWILGEAITAKADVFSYGKLLFEIISGRRNMELLDDGDYFPALIADKISKGEEVLMQFLDHKLEGKADSNEVTRACKVACWCIQDDEKNRPTMTLVIQILAGISEVANPPFPQFLRGFTKYNQTQSVVYQHFTSNTTSSDG